MDERVYLNNLFDIYGELFTEKQRAYFEDYYFNNYTLKEISENEEVTRNAVHKSIKETIEKLYYYEEKLKLYEKEQKIKALDIEEEIKKKIEEIL